MGKVDRSGQSTVLTGSQIRQVIDFARKPYCYVMAIAAYTGCRISESLSLRVENVQGNIITFTKTKTGKPRSVNIHPDLAEILQGELPTEGWLFPSNGARGGLGHLSRQAVDQHLRSVCLALELKGVSTHSFRRSALTTMKNGGIPLKDIAAISGHSSLNELSRYLEVSDQDKQRAIAALCY